MNDDSAWRRLQDAFERHEPVSGTIQKVVGGFFHVDLGGVVGGLPLSHAGVTPPAQPEKLVGETLEFKIIALTRATGNVVLSRRLLVEERRAQRRRDLREGAVVDATVKAVDAIGAYVDLDGVGARLHRTEIREGPPPEPTDVLKPGQRIRVKLLRIGNSTGVEVSLRGVPD